MAMRTRKMYIIYQQIGKYPSDEDRELQRTSDRNKSSDMLRVLQKAGIKAYPREEQY